MAPPHAAQTLLSPAELSYLHTSLSQKPPIRPDLRNATQFRPVVAESAILPTANGSARVCFSDGTEAIVGVKAEVEKTPRTAGQGDDSKAEPTSGMEVDDDGAGDDVGEAVPGASRLSSRREQGSSTWIELSIDIPGQRDDDQLPVFLSSMLKESLQSSDSLSSKLFINERWHWRLYIDVLLLSQALSYPLPLLSLTIHLALLDTCLPRRTSDPEDDPLFDDDWAAAVPLYRRKKESRDLVQKPPVTLLIMTVDDNIICDPSKDELAVADNVVAISVAPQRDATEGLKIIAVRLVDPPSRLTPLGLPQAVSSTATQATAQGGQQAADVQGPTGATRDLQVERERGAVWNPPRGGIKRQMLMRILKMVTEKGGVGEEVLNGLEAVEP